MAGSNDWMVSLRRCEKLIAPRTANAVPLVVSLLKVG
jgi:hypothetical protein